MTARDYLIRASPSRVPHVNDILLRYTDAGAAHMCVCVCIIYSLGGWNRRRDDADNLAKLQARYSSCIALLASFVASFIRAARSARSLVRSMSECRPITPPTSVVSNGRSRETPRDAASLLCSFDRPQRDRARCIASRRGLRVSCSRSLSHPRV